MQSHKIRSTFINYFRNKGHKVVPSSSLVPANDPTLLFTNAGMVQFKDVFLGTEQLSYTRAVTAQRCVRAGGKHNDLDNVGYTARHHTFFEMLGNFSFGDYFKHEAIAYAWEFVTKVLKIPEEQLWVTIYHEDSESEDIWLNQIRVSPERFSRLNESNFWSMGDTGPCGPCSEIFYDHGKHVAGGPPGTPEEDGDRYVEIWNLVFMQFQRDANGKLTRLASPSIDTGMGLERMAAVMQGEMSNYATDLFVPLIQAAAQLTKCSQANHPSLQVIADHIRSSSFLLLDGVTPSNEGRGYVLRRIIRRAIRHGHSLGCTTSFFHQLVAPLVQLMGEAMPELVRNGARIEQALAQEEAQFQRTLNQGMLVLEKAFASIRSRQLPGELLFRLYDTFGFPVDMVGDVARERGYTIDLPGFEKEMERQRQQSRSHASFSARQADIRLEGHTSFVGYDALTCKAQVDYLLKEAGSELTQVESLASGQSGVVVLNTTPFYAESGGQAGDTGLLVAQDGNEFVVEDTRRNGKLIHHLGFVRSGVIALGSKLEAQVNQQQRASIMRNHSATHLMHAALRQVLGDGVMQRGSLVNHIRLRFDFSHARPVTARELAWVSKLVNQHVLANLPVTSEEMPMDKAMQKGALAFFEEKYGEQVRVLSMGEQGAGASGSGKAAADREGVGEPVAGVAGAHVSADIRSDAAGVSNTLEKVADSLQQSFSVELCGGTHVARTGDIGCFHIVSESGVASGVRRIEALTGTAALAHLQTSDNIARQLAAECNTSIDALPQNLAGMQRQLGEQARQIDRLQVRLATAGHTHQSGESIAGVQVLLRQVDATPPSALSQAVDQYKNSLRSGVVVVAGEYQGKVVLAAGVTKDLTDKISAGTLLGELAPLVDGKAGGKPHFAQGGGTNVQAIDKLLEQARARLASLLAESPMAQ